ncbi:Piso0_000160 [Millerozyma farinosa CBS 7064]|uniref:Piso0_000160 protein n=1 Tax=Pichia sorbitophila (strain ATCC MYA-4447 / BCRC 22081 / CBS 7064 / NBRC 10061 / NRRL Y-12695) TaxID=559304 RepID=G8YT88_PICSO|nr:Piso0_000160 [Millerozyma farinosa CBS 7064]
MRQFRSRRSSVSPPHHLRSGISALVVGLLCGFLGDLSTSAGKQYVYSCRAVTMVIFSCALPSQCVQSKRPTHKVALTEKY